MLTPALENNIEQQFKLTLIPLYLYINKLETKLIIKSQRSSYMHLMHIYTFRANRNYKINLK